MQTLSEDHRFGCEPDDPPDALSGRVSIHWTTGVQQPGNPAPPATALKLPGKAPAHGMHLAKSVASPILSVQERVAKSC